MTLKTAIYLFLFLQIGWFVSCNSPGSNPDEIPADVVYNPNTADPNGSENRLPVFRFETTEHDFGRIIEGETVSFQFKFRNEGKTDLIIAEVTTSCGCTVPTYPKTPIAPGEESFIKVAFSSKGRTGYQSKNIVITANTQPNVTRLTIKANVLSPNQLN